MQIIWNVNTLPPSDNCVASLGTFDGVHLGHQTILAELKTSATRLQTRATMVTFEPHPQLVLNNPSRPPHEVLTTIEEKIEILSQLGLDRLVVANFSPAFADLEPERFVTEILLERLKMREIIIGHDHAFGKGRSGNLDLLQRMGAEHGFTVASVPPYRVEDEIVSSTRIRRHLQKGEIEMATAMLGRPYSINGLVVHGEGRGKGMGFPTINLRPLSPQKLVPRAGIYASRCYLEGRSYAAATYIGLKPTFAAADRVIETYIIDFDGQLYGQEVKVDFIAFIREDTRFASTNALVEQIKQDIIKSVEVLASQSSY